MMKRIPQRSNWECKFYSASGTGNTFLIADISGFSLQRYKASLIDALINQNKDTGLLFRYIHKDLYRMYVVEKDGEESAFCGNGARVFAQYLYETKKIELSRLKVQGSDPIYFGKHEKGFFVQCGLPNYLGPYIINNCCFEMFKVCEEPHLITNGFFDRNYLKIVSEKIRKKISVNISCIKDNKILTYERGVEDITLSCGSACIAATEYSLMNNLIDKERKLVKWECLGGTNLIDLPNFSLIGLSTLDLNP